MRLPVHERFIEQAVAYFRQDSRFAGLLAGGSMVYGAMDEYSDLDLIVVYRNEFEVRSWNNGFILRRSWVTYCRHSRGARW